MMTSDHDRQTPVDTLIARTESTKRGLSAAESGTLAQALSREPLPEGVLAPIFLAKPLGTPPSAYVLHKWSKLCLSCGALHAYSDVFALNHLRGNWGRYVKNMTPITRPEWNVPLQVYELAPRTIPFCHECLDLAAAHISMLPLPPVPEAVVGGARPAATGSEAPAAQPRKGTTKFTTDDLLF